MNSAFLMGNGKMTELKGQRGVTPPCEGAQFKRGDIVKVRRNRAVGHFPAELVVLVAVPPMFSPDDAVADLLGEPRPLMKQVGKRSITYILAEDGQPKIYHCREKDILPSGKEPLEIESIGRERLIEEKGK